MFNTEHRALFTATEESIAAAKAFAPEIQRRNAAWLESFDRSGNDGFRTQAALASVVRELEAHVATLTLNNGYAHRVIFENVKDGELFEAVYRTNKFGGTSLGLKDAAGDVIEWLHASAAHYAKHGLRMVVVVWRQAPRMVAGTVEKVPFSLSAAKVICSDYLAATAQFGTGAMFTGAIEDATGYAWRA